MSGNFFWTHFSVFFRDLFAGNIFPRILTHLNCCSHRLFSEVFLQSFLQFYLFFFYLFPELFFLGYISEVLSEDFLETLPWIFLSGNFFRRHFSVFFPDLFPGNIFPRIFIYLKFFLCLSDFFSESFSLGCISPRSFFLEYFSGPFFRGCYSSYYTYDISWHRREDKRKRKLYRRRVDTSKKRWRRTLRWQVTACCELHNE